MNWFTVKTLYRTRPMGRPRARDDSYTPGLAAVEERVVLFKAKDGPAALRKGLREAAKYAKSLRASNVYGQRLSTKVLDFAEVYEMFGKPGDGAEIFSSITIEPASESAAGIIRRRIGRPSGLDTFSMFVAGFVTERLRDEGVSV